MKASQEFAKVLMGVLHAAFPSRGLSEDTARYYSDELVRLVDDVGSERAEAAVRGTLRDPAHVFFPNIAEIRAHVPPKPSIPNSALTNADPGCRKCDGTGWQAITVIGERDSRVRRCDCWTRNVTAGLKRSYPLKTAAELQDARRSPQCWVFKGLLAVMQGRQLPKNRPQGTQEYLDKLQAAHPTVRLYKKLQDRITSPQKQASFAAVSA